MTCLINYLVPKVPLIHFYLDALIQANVMLEYELDEGESLLKEKQAKSLSNLEATNKMIDDVRENITTMEVNMARIFNWDVKRRQAEKEKALAKK
jgi:hypothetical protein